MATVVIMPKQGQSVESCILTEMKKKKGDTVAVGDILFSYETDKASFEEEAKVAGTVLDVFFDNGDEIPVFLNQDGRIFVFEKTRFLRMFSCK